LEANNWQTQLRKGLLDIVVLNLLQHGRCHGYEMVQTLKQIDGLKVREGNIYPILARLQIDGLVASQSEPSKDGPPRKYFELTKLGQETLAEMNMHWNQMVENIEKIRKGSKI
jgi:PadR family transcriptional regulator PadR